MCYCDIKQIKINNICIIIYNYNVNLFDKFLYIVLYEKRRFVWKIKFYMNNFYYFFLKLLINIEIFIFIMWMKF